MKDEANNIPAPSTSQFTPHHIPPPTTSPGTVRRVYRSPVRDTASSPVRQREKNHPPRGLKLQRNTDVYSRMADKGYAPGETDRRQRNSSTGDPIRGDGAARGSEVPQNAYALYVDQATSKGGKRRVIRFDDGLSSYGDVTSTRNHPKAPPVTHHHVPSIFVSDADAKWTTSPSKSILPQRSRNSAAAHNLRSSAPDSLGVWNSSSSFSLTFPMLKTTSATTTTTTLADSSPRVLSATQGQASLMPSFHGPQHQHYVSGSRRSSSESNLPSLSMNRVSITNNTLNIPRGQGPIFSPNSKQSPTQIKTTKSLYHSVNSSNFSAPANASNYLQRQPRGRHPDADSLAMKMSLPCRAGCCFCVYATLLGPVKVYFTRAEPLKKGPFLGGIKDGNGKPAIPASRKSDVRGLVYDRKSHSLHPPARGQRPMFKEIKSEALKGKPSSPKATVKGRSKIIKKS